MGADARQIFRPTREWAVARTVEFVPMRYARLVCASPFVVGPMLVAAPSARAADRVCEQLARDFLVPGTVEQRRLDRELALAAEKGCVAILRERLGRGASPRARDRTGRTALHHAARGAKEETARLLLEAGADLAAPDLAGSTPFLLASELDQVDVVRFLLEHGAPVDRPGRSGLTPLAAVFNGNERLVALLLEHGADPGWRDREGLGLAELAAEPAIAERAPRTQSAPK